MYSAGAVALTSLLLHFLLLWAFCGRNDQRNQKNARQNVGAPNLWAMFGHIV